MNQPIISIIVPIYNVEKELPRCLDSLINQTFRDIEIICVIDGSPDNSLMVCNKYGSKDSRIVIIVQENQGLSGARNTGLSHARGQYIQFCDPDDYYAPDMCEKLYDAISSSNADLAIAGIQVFYEQVQSTANENEYYRIKGSGLTTVNEYVIRKTDCSSCNKIFRKSIIDMYAISFPHGLHFEDACFFYKYLFVSKTIYYVPEYLYTYIRHDNSIMSNTFKKTPWANDHVKILQDIKNFLLKNNLFNSYEIDVFLWIIISSAYFAISWGMESAYNSTVEIVSGILADISDTCIQSCPYVSKKEIKELMALKNNDLKLFLQFMHANRRLKRILAPLLPVGSKRREFVKNLYKEIYRG
jgi:glycosyltransferase involved in cell wall biosynthesis